LAEQASRADSTHIGEVGKKVSFKGTLVSTNAYANAYGVSTRCVFRTDGGSTVIWWASNPPEMTKGATYEVTGTVKAHDTYKGERQTVLTRCKVKAG
jgi:hypothetical protein